MWPNPEILTVVDLAGDGEGEFTLSRWSGRRLLWIFVVVNESFVGVVVSMVNVIRDRWVFSMRDVIVKRGDRSICCLVDRRVWQYQDQRTKGALQSSDFIGWSTEYPISVTTPTELFFLKVFISTWKLATQQPKQRLKLERWFWTLRNTWNLSPSQTNRTVPVLNLEISVTLDQSGASMQSRHLVSRLYLRNTKKLFSISICRGEPPIEKDLRQ